MKSNINSVEVHPQLSNNGHRVDGALVGAGSLWRSDPTLKIDSRMDGGVLCYSVSSNNYVYKKFHFL
jgi:hypothetical protein